MNVFIDLISDFYYSWRGSNVKPQNVDIQVVEGNKAISFLFSMWGGQNAIYIRTIIKWATSRENMSSGFATS